MYIYGIYIYIYIVRNVSLIFASPNYILPKLLLNEKFLKKLPRGLKPVKVSSCGSADHVNNAESCRCQVSKHCYRRVAHTYILLFCDLYVSCHSNLRMENKELFLQCKKGDLEKVR